MYTEQESSNQGKLLCTIWDSPEIALEKLQGNL